MSTRVFLHWPTCSRLSGARQIALCLDFFHDISFPLFLPNHFFSSFPILYIHPLSSPIPLFPFRSFSLSLPHFDISEAAFSEKPAEEGRFTDWKAKGNRRKIRFSVRRQTEPFSQVLVQLWSCRAAADKRAVYGDSIRNLRIAIVGEKNAVSSSVNLSTPPIGGLGWERIPYGSSVEAAIPT